MKNWPKKSTWQWTSIVTYTNIKYIAQLAAASLLLLLTSCNTTRYLDESKGERLLVKNSLEIKTPKKLTNKTEIVANLEPLFKQQPNSRVIYRFRFRLWMYYKFRNKNSRFAKWSLKTIAEPPTLYSDALTQRTLKNFENYLHQRGFFDAKVTSYTRFFGKNFLGDDLYYNQNDAIEQTEKLAKVTYTLNFGERYTIDSLHFASRDSNVLALLLQSKSQSNLNVGGPLDGATFDAEKLRITAEMKDNGYAYFIPNFIAFTGDTIAKKTNVTVEVLPQNDTTLHQKFIIGKVIAFFSLVPDFNSIRSDTTIGGIYFASSEPKFMVLPSRLNANIAIRPGQPYKQSDFDETYRNLNGMGVFKFVSIKPSPDSLAPNKLNITIALAPNKRFSIGWGLDLNNSKSVVSGQLLGTLASMNMQNRNLLGGAEHLQTTISYNVELKRNSLFKSSDVFNSQEFKFQNDLVVPRFYDYFGLWKNLNRFPTKKTPLVNNNFYENLKADGQTSFSASYNYLNLIKYYAYNLFHSSFGYDLRRGNNQQFSFDHFGVDLLYPDTLTEKWSDLAQNEFIRRSFGDQLFTGFVFRSFNYSYLGANNNFGERWNLQFGTELSGAEEMAIKKIWSAFFGPEPAWKVGNLVFSKYIRAEIDGSYTRDFKKNLTGVFRLSSGVVLPFGDTRTTPYIKQFFVGGPNSIRAWRIRELGPGRYFDAALKPTAPPYYQTGDFRFEFNGELRFPLWWIFKGAVFLDGGNIWTLQKEEARPGGQLRWDSYKDFALGTGFGVRVDISFAVIRFDLGLKLRRPYQPIRSDNTLGPNWLWGNWKKEGESPLNFNIAVGYPF